LRPPNTTDIFSFRYAISRYEYAIASRLVFSAAVHSAIDVVEISENALANGLVIDGTAERITPEVDY
jgi:hypothetical protein